MYEKNIIVHGSWFASFLIQFLLKKNFNLDTVSVNSKFDFIPTWMNEIVIPTLKSIFQLDYSRIFREIDILDMNNSSFKNKWCILSPLGIDQCFHEMKNNFHPKKVIKGEEINIYAKREDFVKNWNRSSSFLYKLVFCSAKARKWQKNFEFSINKMPVYWYSGWDGNYYIAWYIPINETYNWINDAKNFLKINRINIDIFQFKEFHVYNDYNDSMELLIWSWRWFGPIILWLSNQLAIIDTLLTIMFIISNNKVYLDTLLKFRKKIFLDMDSYLKNFTYFKYEEANPIFNRVNYMIEKVTYLYILFLKNGSIY